MFTRAVVCCLAPRRSDPGCNEPGQSGSSDAAAGGRGDDDKQVTDAAASGHPLHDRGYARAHTQWQEMFLPPDYAEFNQTPMSQSVNPGQERLPGSLCHLSP